MTRATEKISENQRVRSNMLTIDGFTTSRNHGGTARFDASADAGS
jgi:hypothetical protein